MSTETPYSPPPVFRKKKGPDNAAIGLVAGLAAAFIGIVLLYFVWGNGNFGHYAAMFFDTGNPRRVDAASKVVALSLFMNLIPFYFFINRKAYQSTKGVMLGTFLYCVVILLYKFVWQ